MNRVLTQNYVAHIIWHVLIPGCRLRKLPDSFDLKIKMQRDNFNSTLYFLATRNWRGDEGMTFAGKEEWRSDVEDDMCWWFRLLKIYSKG